MHRLKSICSVFALILLLSSCNNDEVKQPSDTLSSGTIDISVDETFKPVIQEELKVFDSSFPEAHITAHYKPEAECINDFMNDKARLILVTRDLSGDEKKILEQKKVVPTSLAVAKDGLAILMNKDNPDDTVLGLSEIKGILAGVYKKKYTVVLDNAGSSTLRYITDSLIPHEKLGSNVYAAKGNDSVADYVSKNVNAIGFAGVSTVSDFTDPAGLAFIDKVRVAWFYNDSLRKMYKPYQAYIAPNWYKLTRNLYFIHRETYPGLGTGFANFLTRERGQLIFKQARLFPLRSNIIFREAAVNP